MAIATPLAFCAAKQYQRQHRGGNYVGIIAWMIVSWIIYVISVLNNLSAVGVGAGGGDVAVGWVAALFIVSLIAWALMLVHAELSRCKKMQGA